MKALTALIAACFVLAGCATQERSHTASLVDFLYPKNAAPQQDNGALPKLEVPLTVGLAFVPPRTECRCGEPSAALQSELLERVRARFASRNYIRAIKVIPEAYLRGGRDGFLAIEQLSRLYGFDVIALVSYDQVAKTSENAASLLYWSIVGAYVVPGNTSDVSTFVDTAVLDVHTRKLLLRAPGIDTRTFHRAAVGNERAVAQQQDEALRVATDRMIANLDTELAAFRERIKSDNSVIVTRRPGSAGGAGSPGGLTLAGLLFAALLRRRSAHR